MQCSTTVAEWESACLHRIAETCSASTLMITSKCIITHASLLWRVHPLCTIEEVIQDNSDCGGTGKDAIVKSCTLKPACCRIALLCVSRKIVELCRKYLSSRMEVVLANPCPVVHKHRERVPTRVKKNCLEQPYPKERTSAAIKKKSG